MNGSLLETDPSSVQWERKSLSIWSLIRFSILYTIQTLSILETQFVNQFGADSQDLTRRVARVSGRALVALATRIQVLDIRGLDWDKAGPGCGLGLARCSAGSPYSLHTSILVLGCQKLLVLWKGESPGGSFVQMETWNKLLFSQLFSQAACCLQHGSAAYASSICLFHKKKGIILKYCQILRITICE